MKQTEVTEMLARSNKLPEINVSSELCSRILVPFELLFVSVASCNYPHASGKILKFAISVAELS